jgi:hypothetical protein
VQRLSAGEEVMGATTNCEPAEDKDMNSVGEGQEADEELGYHTGFNIHEEALGQQVDDLYRDGVIGRKELHQIWNDIASTIHPGWQTGPPPNFGAPTHGKLKADQWRYCIEFDIPVSLVQLWATDNAPDDEQ